MNNLALRAITGIVGVASIITAVIYSPYTSAAIFGLIMLATLKEFYGLARKVGSRPFEVWGLGFAIIFFALIFFYFQMSLSPNLFWLLPALFAIVFIYPLQTIEKSHAIQCLAISILGVMYIAVPFSMIHSIGFIEGAYAYELILGVLFLQWANDTGAYFVGKAIGKRKLFEKVSPKKTWEGTIGGFLFGLVFAYGFFHFFGVLTLFEWMGLGIITAVFGTLGDLAESLFKRTLAIKDSGSILPGHGGFLDRFDGLLLSLPFSAAYLHFIL
ncbi:MAG TPA: phosphatidate cytidylyltransferase [Roseivirga sp.]